MEPTLKTREAVERSWISVAPIQIGQVHIESGDIVFGDRDGVCVVPKEAIEDAFTRAIEKARGEKLVKKALQSGMSAQAAFDKYGIM